VVLEFYRSPIRKPEDSSTENNEFFGKLSGIGITLTSLNTSHFV